jgi:PAS domain-containing protein
LQFIEHYTSQVTIANVLNKNIHTLFHTLNLQMSEMLFHKRYASLLNEIEYFKEAIDVSKAGYFLWDLDEQIHFCTEEVGVILGKRNVVLPHDLELYLSSNASGNNYLASRFQLSTFNELYCTEGTVSRYIWIKGELAYRNSRLIYIKGVIQDVSEQYCLQVNTCKNTTYHFYGKKHGTIVFNNLLF